VLSVLEPPVVTAVCWQSTASNTLLRATGSPARHSRDTWCCGDGSCSSCVRPLHVESLYLLPLTAPAPRACPAIPCPMHSLRASGAPKFRFKCPYRHRKCVVNVSKIAVRMCIDGPHVHARPPFSSKCDRAKTAVRG
jgi:hypothetical protein